MTTKRSSNFITTEKELFLELFKKYSATVESKKSDTSAVSLKKKAWIDITETYNALTSNGPRTEEQLKLLWKNYKARAKKQSALLRRESIATGGGPSKNINVDENLEVVSGKHHDSCYTSHKRKFFS